MISIVVTGVGGPLGQAIVKAARASLLPLRLIGTDCHSLSVGLHWVDQGCILPNCRARDQYLDEMIRLCAAQNVAMILPGSDSELELLSSHADQVKELAGSLVMASPPQVLGIALDKLGTCEFLERSGLAFPRYAPSTDIAAVRQLADTVGFPLFVKPRRGSGSQRIVKVKSWDEWHRLQPMCEEFVVQEYLSPDHEEYTAASFTDQQGRQIGCIVLRRELAAGNTYRAWVTHDDAIEQEVKAVVAALGAVGPCNVQLRLTASGPVTFEINPRFSGTTAMRAHFGYNEVAMALRSFVLGEPLEEPILCAGTALRFWEEYYPDPAPTRSSS